MPRGQSWFLICLLMKGTRLLEKLFTLGLGQGIYREYTGYIESPTLIQDHVAHSSLLSLLIYDLALHQREA